MSNVVPIRPARPEEEMERLPWPQTIAILTVLILGTAFMCGLVAGFLAWVIS